MKFIMNLSGEYIAVETIARFKPLIDLSKNPKEDNDLVEIEIITKRGEKHNAIVRFLEFKKLIGE